MNGKLRDDIIQHLTKKGNYDADVDDMVIDILVKNVGYAETLCGILERDGLQVTIPNGNGIETTKENPAFGTYIKCLDSIHTCSAKLGIGRKDRIALKLIEERERDEFDREFSD